MFQNLPDLPDLGGDVVMTEFKDGKGDFATWSHVCHWVKVHLIHHDQKENGAGANSWKAFMTSYDTSSLPDDFPRAMNYLYIGAIAGWIYLESSDCLMYLKLDDGVDAIPVHLCNGVWGLIATGLWRQWTKRSNRSCHYSSASGGGNGAGMGSSD